MNAINLIKYYVPDIYERLSELNITEETYINTIDNYGIVNVTRLSDNKYKFKLISNLMEYDFYKPNISDYVLNYYGLYSLKFYNDLYYNTDNSYTIVDKNTIGILVDFNGIKIIEFTEYLNK